MDAKDLDNGVNVVRTTSNYSVPKILFSTGMRGKRRSLNTSCSRPPEGDRKGFSSTLPCVIHHCILYMGGSGEVSSIFIAVSDTNTRKIVCSKPVGE